MTPLPRPRLLLLRLLLLAGFLLLLGRLVQLQLLEGRYLRRLSRQNCLRAHRLPAPRGRILDRRGNCLATSRPAFALWITPAYLPEARRGSALSLLANILHHTPSELRSLLEDQGRPDHEPLLLQRDLDPAALARLHEQQVYLPGVTLSEVPQRCYPHGSVGAHVLGFVREIDARELAAPSSSDYRAGDLIGKSGLEKQYEHLLRGPDGFDLVEVDSAGRPLRSLESIPPRPGRDLTLTLDLHLQQAAEQALLGKSGAAVALDPRRGEVLALASSPTYDPNLFTRHLSPPRWRLLNSPLRPQQNRAISAAYPPGSVFKLVTAAAALDRGVLSTDSQFFCPGYYGSGRWRIKCWKPAGHGRVNLFTGFAQSCNVMFLTLGRRLGLRPLLETARAFGLGQTTGLDLPAERSGLLPTPEWKKAANGEPWFPGDTLQLAIGQGGLLVTPLQVAVQAAAIANGGSLVTPHLLLSPRRPASSPPRPSLGLSPQDLSLLRQAMTRVVAPGGTAASIYMPGLAVAGKTGTAENPAGAPHSWFVGFAPADDPKIVVAVLVEHGGPDHAAPPIARKLLLAAGRNGYFKLPPRYQQDSSSPAHSPKPAAVAARP